MTDSDVPNPVSLLTRFAADGGTAEEILICTYNQTLPFFERHLLGPCRATGARITVLGDITMAEHDLAAINRANRRYYAGNVRARRSFHPKLIAVADSTSALVAVGSGNLTVAGWIGNDELWTIHHANPEHASPVVAAAGDWCRRLPNAVTLSRLSAQALDRMASRLSQFEPAPDIDTTLLDNLDQPIIEQLPHGPVDELNLYAPFHDTNARATRQLIERLEPHTVRLAYQPGLTSADGPALAAALPLDVELIELAPTPYRHGKLIEWRTNDQWSSVTGSPNLSTPALCATARTDGNVELAVLAPSNGPLLPDGAPAGLGDVAGLRMAGTDSGRRELPLLLAATLINDHIEVEFARSLDQPATLQLAEPETRPDAWPHSEPVQAGATHFNVGFHRAGSRVRLKLDDGRFSNTTFVADPDEILTPPGRTNTQPATPPPTIDDIFTDPYAARRFLELLDDIQRPAFTGTTPATPHDTTDDDVSTVGDWRDYLATAEAALSAQTIAFALGRRFEDHEPKTTHRLYIHDWDGIGPDDTAGDLDDDDPDSAADETPTVISGYRIRQETRAAGWRSLTRAPIRDPLIGLTTLRLMTTFVAAGGFDTHDTSWVPTVLAITTSLANLDPGPELETEVGSLTAVALAMTASTLSPVISTGHHARQRTATQHAAHLLVAAEPELVEEYASDLTTRFGSAVNVDTVMRYAARIVNADPLDDAVNDMRRAGFSPTQDGHRIEIVEDVAAPIGSALSAISRCRSLDLVSVMCRTNDTWALAAWQRPNLLILRPGANGRSYGAVYELTGMIGLGALHAGELTEISDHENHHEMFSPLQEPGELSSAILAATGWNRSGEPQ